MVVERIRDSIFSPEIIFDKTSRWASEICFALVMMAAHFHSFWLLKMQRLFFHNSQRCYCGIVLVCELCLSLKAWLVFVTCVAFDLETGRSYVCPGARIGESEFWIPTQLFGTSCPKPAMHVLSVIKSSAVANPRVTSDVSLCTKFDKIKKDVTTKLSATNIVLRCGQSDQAIFQFRK
jgi:hypothetical protein